MIIAGLMKRLIGQIPVRMQGNSKVTVGKCKDFGTQVGNLMILIKKRTSIREVFNNTLSVDMRPTETLV